MGIWASAGSRAWCPIVRAPAAELAPEQGPDRSWPQRPEAAWPGPPARCGSPPIESGPRRSGACTGPTLAGRTVQRGPGHPQRLEHFRTNRSILGRGGLGAAATERWPAPGPAARAGGSTRSGRRARPASCPCPSSKPSRSACHLLGDRLAFCHLKTHRTPPPGPAGPRGASVLRGHLHMRQSIAFEDFSGEATRPATSRPCSLPRCAAALRRVPAVDAEGHPRVDRRGPTSGDPRRPHRRDRPGRRTTTSASTSGGAIARSAGGSSCSEHHAQEPAATWSRTSPCGTSRRRSDRPA